MSRYARFGSLSDAAAARRGTPDRPLLALDPSRPRISAASRRDLENVPSLMAMMATRTPSTARRADGMVTMATMATRTRDEGFSPRAAGRVVSR